MALPPDPARDGVEGPAAGRNRAAGMGDYRPDRWFGGFDGLPPRDPGR